VAIQFVAPDLARRMGNEQFRMGESCIRPFFALIIPYLRLLIFDRKQEISLSLRGAERRGNLPQTLRLLRFTRNDMFYYFTTL